MSTLQNLLIIASCLLALNGFAQGKISRPQEINNNSIEFNSFKLGDGEIYIPSFLTYKGEADDGPYFTDTTGKIRLYIDHGANQPYDLYHSFVTEEIGNGHPVLDIKKSNYFVQSGFNYDGEVYYTKFFLDKTTTPTTFYTATIIYPTNKKNIIDNLIPSIFNSFPNLDH